MLASRLTGSASLAIALRSTSINKPHAPHRCIQAHSQEEPTHYTVELYRCKLNDVAMAAMAVLCISV